MNNGTIIFNGVDYTGGGALAIDQLSNVEISNVKDKDVLVYDEEQNLWKNDTVTSGTTDYEELDHLPLINNVELSGNLTSTDLGILWNGTKEQYEEDESKIPDGTIVNIINDYRDSLPPMTSKEWKDLDKTNIPDGASVIITDDYESTICNTVQDCIDSESDDDVAGASALTELKSNTDTAFTNYNAGLANKLKGGTILKISTFSANATLAANTGGQLLIPFTRPSGYIPIFVSPAGCGAWSWVWCSCVLEASNNRANCIIKSTLEGGTFPVSVNVLFVKENFI